MTLWTRHGSDFTDRLTRIAEAVRSLPAESALIDSEVVVFRPDGHSDFAAMRTKDGAQRAGLVAFDLFAKACELGVEGIVSKRLGSAYLSGPCRNWLKVKTRRSREDDAPP